MNSMSHLDKIFAEVETVVLSRQHPVTGLLPASTAVNTHGDYTDAWVRDNVYSIMCVWSLGVAYRKQGEKVRSDQLEQATIKLMRGLLESMMRQAHKVEAFKHTLNPMDSLHAKYDTATGLPVVADDAWGHLQIDATSLYLLMLAQMTARGLRIVFTYDEVDFVQNLIYYIASAYRTPDFGIWERGNKINNGKTEINASSVGMAKAALQALDGFNLFGKNASPRAVVHSVADAVSLARATLASLLPRESLSKEVDSALLSVIGFPAFAVGDENLVRKTRDKILAELGGNYGCKRFIWDGHQTAVEDGSRLYYEHTELANFENIESEWPLFFCFLYVDALFSENEANAKHYRDKIEKLMVEEHGINLIPELYYLPPENIAAEKKKPQSQPRVPNENIPLVWAQSLYITGLLMDEGYVRPDDLDPLKMRRRSTRFVQPQIALVVLAENEEVKNILVDNGVIAETIEDIRPIGVISAPHLMDAYHQVGANSALGLTGRPMRRLQSLTTSQTYDINGRPHLCLSWVQGDEDDFRSYDATRISHKIDQEMQHIRKHWLNNEVAVFTFMVEGRTCTSPDAEVLYQTLREYQLRTNNERVGYASAKLAYRASRNNKFFIPNICLTPMHFAKVMMDKTLAEFVPKNLNKDAQSFVTHYQHWNKLAASEADQKNYALINAFLEKYGLDDNLSEEANYPVRELLEFVYKVACQDNHWLTARYLFNVLDKVQNVLADGLVLLASRHLSVVVGDKQSRYLTLEGSPNDRKIADMINSITEDPLEKTLVQEVLAIVGALVRTSPNYFDGLRSIYVHNLLSLCAIDEDASDESSIPENAIRKLAALSPADVLMRLLNILEAQQRSFKQGLTFEFTKSDRKSSLLSDDAEKTHALDTDWLEWRSARGLIPRFDEPFLKAIWQSLNHTDCLIFGDGASEECAMHTEYPRLSMTPGEESFARLVDQHSQQVHPPYYKSAILETLYAYTLYCEKNPDVHFGSSLNLGTVLEKAADLYVTAVGKTELTERNVDEMFEQSPVVLQKYLEKALSSFHA